MLDMFLRKIGWLDVLVLDLPIDKATFIRLLQQKTSAEELVPFDGFIATNQPYRGTVTANGFKLKAKPRAFSFKNTGATATGRFLEGNGATGVAIEIIGLSKVFLILLLSGPLGLAVILFVVLPSTEIPSALKIAMVIGFTWGEIAPIIIGRLYTKRLKKQLKNDFETWVAQHNTPPPPPKRPPTQFVWITPPAARDPLCSE